MPKVYFLPERVEVEVKEGETLLNAALAAGIPHVKVCGGIGRCSTCRVIVLEGLDNCSPPTKDEHDIIMMLNLPPNVRMACQTTITGPVKVRRLVEELEDVDFFSIFIEGVEVLTALGEEKDIFILFADIQGFTNFAEDLLPYDVLYSLNLYLSQMGEIVKRNNGRIDNYMGDGFMALFESDSPAAGARRAVRAALEMLEEVKRLAPYLQELYGRSFDIRIGLHFGRVVAGKLGYPGSKRGTVIGNAVNLASRIENANKEFGTRFLISREIYELIKDEIQVGKEISTTIQGKTGACQLYEVVGLKGTVNSELREKAVMRTED
jgi:adenylate cyclase